MEKKLMDELVKFEDDITIYRRLMAERIAVTTSKMEIVRKIALKTQQSNFETSYYFLNDHKTYDKDLGKEYTKLIKRQEKLMKKVKESKLPELDKVEKIEELVSFKTMLTDLRIQNDLAFERFTIYNNMVSRY